MVLIYTTLLNDIAKPTIVLWVIVLFSMLALYISYIYYTRVEKPIYLNKINYDAYLNQTSNSTNNTTTGKVNQTVIKPTTNSGKKIDSQVDYSKLQEFANLQACPQGECAIKINGNLIGVKRCPATSDGIIMYDITQEQCVQSNLCPSSIPYAQQLNNEALTGDCGIGNDGCNCLEKPQCATYVTKYFNNIGLGNNGQGSTGLNYSFTIEGSKTDSNFYNPLQLELDQLGKVFCKLNPAFVDTIVNGCPLTNHWTDPTDCQNYQNVIFTSNNNLTVTVQNPSSVYKYFNSSNIPKDVSDSVYYSNDNSLAIIVSGLQTNPPEELPYVGYFFKSNDGTSVLKYTDYVKAIVNVNKGENFYILKNVSYYDDGEKIFIPGVNNYVQTNDNLTFNYFDFTFCNDSAVDGANNKSMLMCVQDDNQPCTSGVLAYNFDRTVTQSNNSRNFCQAYDQPGVDRLAISGGVEASIKTFYLTDPAYFTQSCVIGYGCGTKIDTTQCDSTNFDCTNAIREKKKRFFPVFDDSAVSNVWQVGPLYTQLDNFGTSITLNSSNGNEYFLKNNLFNLEDGDYYQINNIPINDIFVMQKAQLLDNKLILNTTNGLNIGDRLLNPSINNQKVTITAISGNEITISTNITNDVLSLFKSGTHLLFNNSEADYGIVRINYNIFNNSIIENSFYLLDLQTLEKQSISIETIKSTGIVFYKQFGFNGLNYNTIYNTSTFERDFSDSYQYGVLNNLINPALQLAIKPPFIVENLISNFSGNNTITEFNKQVFNTPVANFKQKNSMYYPVWNEENFKQECVFCSPSLYALPIISEQGKVTAVNIQFSGKNFYQYTKDINSQIFKESGGKLPAPNYFMFTMYALTSTKSNEPSTPNMIYLQNPNLDIQEGDFVIDAAGIIKVKILDSSNNLITTQINKTDLTTFEQMFINDLLYVKKPSLLPSDLTTSTYNNIKLIPNSNTGNTQNNVNLFAGKKYYISSTSDYYIIVPTIQVVSVGQSGRVVFTDSIFTKPIPKNTLLQFIRPTSIISLELQGDINAVSKTTSYANQPVYAGANAEIYVNEITEGRITNISVQNQGSNYLITNKPLLYVNQYKINSGILIKS